jgi:hypothetical protein
MAQMLTDQRQRQCLLRPAEQIFAAHILDRELVRRDTRVLKFERPLDELV